MAHSNAARISLGALAAVVLAASAVLFAPKQASASPTPQPRLWLMNPDGTAQRQIAEPVDWSSGFEWAPDGGRLAFSDYDDLFVTNRDGSEVLNVTETSPTGSLGYERQPTWSPDGAQIAFVDGSDIWVSDATGTNRRTITASATYETFPRWAPAGGRVAYLSSVEAWGGPHHTLHVSRVDGSGDIVVAPVTDRPYPFSWAPDGDRIAYATREGAIVARDLETGLETTLVTAGASAPAWSPDGAWVAYAASDGLNVVPATGGTPRRLSDSINRWTSSISWSPDSSKIAFSTFGISVVDLGSGSISNLTHQNETDEDYSPAWSPDGSQIAFIGVIWCCAPNVSETVVGISARRHLVVRGQLEAWWLPDCIVDRSVKVQRRFPSGWRTVAGTRSDDTGRYRVRIPDRIGRYRAVARAVELDGGDGTFTCLRGVSPIVRHRH